MHTTINIKIGSHDAMPSTYFHCASATRHSINLSKVPCQNVLHALRFYRWNTLETTCAHHIVVNKWLNIWNGGIWLQFRLSLRVTKQGRTTVLRAPCRPYSFRACDHMHHTSDTHQDSENWKYYMYLRVAWYQIYCAYHILCGFVYVFARMSGDVSKKDLQLGMTHHISFIWFWINWSM